MFDQRFIHQFKYRIFHVILGLCSILGAHAESNIELFLADGSPVSGEVIRVDNDRVTIKKSGQSTPVFYKLSDFSEYTQRQLMTQALESVFSLEGMILVQAKTEKLRNDSNEDVMVYKGMIRNQSNIELPKDLIVAYNIYDITFYPLRSQSTKGRYTYTHHDDIRNTGYLFYSKGIPANGIFEFATSDISIRDYSRIPTGDNILMRT